MSINDDILLLKLIQSGNEQAFKYLFDTYFASLCRFAHVYVSDTQDAEELILELFVHIWEHRNEINITLSFKAYLFQAARNRCLNYLRDNRSMLRLEEVEEEIKMKISRLLKWRNCNILLWRLFVHYPINVGRFFNIVGMKTSQIEK